MAIVAACENQLGWQPPYQPDVPPQRTLSLEVYKLKKAMETSRFRQLATPRNLALALEYSRQRRLPVKSPVGLLYRIPDALALASHTPTVAPIQERITASIRWEQARDDGDSLRWIHLLVRAAGPGQTEILQEWKQAGRG